VKRRRRVEIIKGMGKKRDGNGEKRREERDGQGGRREEDAWKR